MSKSFYNTPTCNSLQFQPAVIESGEKENVLIEEEKTFFSFLQARLYTSDFPTQTKGKYKAFSDFFDLAYPIAFAEEFTNVFFPPFSILIRSEKREQIIPV